MIVRTIGSGREILGLYIGVRNVRRHFRRESQHIELLLGHLHIYCDLPAEFWSRRPEITDSRLADWISSRIFHGRRHGGPVPIALIPIGRSAFRVQPFTMPSVSMNALTHIGPPRTRHDL